MDSSAFDLLVVPILWGTLGSISAGAVLLLAMQTVEALLKHRVSTPASWEAEARSSRAPLPRTYRPAARGGAIRVHG
jgi:hypothetical protein